jgi:hypothetical protein
MESRVIITGIIVAAVLEEKGTDLFFWFEVGAEDSE